ncbi:hypothetical protein CF342_06325 [Pseudomonas aeruginosa]|uniref:hypothetical protein n=1 Tax=Pseudomonas aeruginosa TaxID=287 RepID=UPI00053D5E03|nr:hypothetical protein [Pseudomonas aeruginosa]ALZ06983.1 hypothetical protein HV99_08880 [Pseudomonas aeruginosa]EIU1689435.1 hypothetical protein [Pseudomonas aeruginosa]EIU7208016.1 hypothetical protein [Pseudomonas aeruginosa]EIU7214500.1 hypothetical protein [Pseudomonas aeruginosa]EKV4826562.1 hypothetical protein [Pseudomonas aeruginosa]
MTRQLKPWAYGPFEVLLHAETHYRIGEDLDRRVAMIGFDNAIEVAITTYLNLHPMQRGNRTYPKVDVERWLNNFHTKAEFFFIECGTRSITANAKQDEVIWFHDVRNGQYHVGGATVPQRRELDGVRAAALEVFSVLFDEPDVMSLLAEYLAEMSPLPPPPRSDEHDRLIDGEHGMVDVCGQPEYASDVLYALDPNRYREVALELQVGSVPPTDEEAGA